ncbi:hypothetical protein NQ315_012925, partial [Exocentrus adspersus]
MESHHRKNRRVTSEKRQNGRIIGIKIKEFKEFCSKLNLKTRKTESVVSGLNNTVSNINSIVDVKIHSRINAFSTTLSCLLIDKITTNIPCVSFEQKNISIPPNLILADPSFNISAKIDMLIGADTFWNLLCIGQIKLGKNAPILQKTCLGWVVSGPIYLDKKSKLNTVCNLTVETNCDDALNHQLQKFWTIEDLPCKKYYSDEEAYCEEYFLKTSTRDETGRFIVSFPLKEPVSKLGDSRKIAERRFYAIER